VSTEPKQIQRMPLNQRAQHWILIITFSLLVLTGLPNLLDPHIPLLHSVLSREDVFWFRGLLHRIAGVGIILLGFYHLLYIIFSEQGNRDFKALMLGLKDARDAAGTLTYQMGLPKTLQRTGWGRWIQRTWSAWLPLTHPRYGRYTFIEKFEYLGVAWGTILMAVTGLMLWFEEATMALVPLYVFDFVRVVHSYEAILAFATIIIWHMYQVHFRPGQFPMNRSWLDGNISIEEMKEEHPLEYEALLGAADGQPLPGAPPT